MELGPYELVALSARGVGAIAAARGAITVTPILAHRGPDRVLVTGSTGFLRSQLQEPCEEECDGEPLDTFTLADAQRLLEYLFDDGELECPLRLDADGDGELTIGDAVAIVRGDSLDSDGR